MIKKIVVKKRRSKTNHTFFGDIPKVEKGKKQFKESKKKEV